MKGRYPIRRTLEYLQKGDIIFKNRVKIMTVNYNTHGELSDGARSELTTASQKTFPAKHCKCVAKRWRQGVYVVIYL